jgi:antitoxin CcdA
MADTKMPAHDQRRATNVTLPETLVSQTKALKINISQACEAGLADEVKAVRAKQWLEENKAAFEYWNEKTEREGLTLERYRARKTAILLTCHRRF